MAAKIVPASAPVHVNQGAHLHAFSSLNNGKLDDFYQVETTKLGEGAYGQRPQRHQARRLGRVRVAEAPCGKPCTSPRMHCAPSRTVADGHKYIHTQGRCFCTRCARGKQKNISQFPLRCRRPSTAERSPMENASRRKLTSSLLAEGVKMSGRIFIAH